jgi:ATP-binding cassette subfamily B protein
VNDIINLLKLTRAHRAAYSVAVAGVIVVSGSYLVIPSQFGRLMASLHNVATGHQDAAARNSVLAIAGLLALQALGAFVHGFLVSSASEQIVNELRARFFRNLVSQRLDERPSKALGEIASGFSSDLSLVQDGLSTTLLDCTRDILVTLGSFAGLLVIHFKMTLIAVLGVGIVAAVIALFIRKATAAVLSIQQYRAKVLTLLLEGAANAYIIQAYAREHYMNARFMSWLDGMYARVRRYLLLVACMNPVCLVVFSGVMAVLAMYGVHELVSARLSVAQLVSYFTFAVIMIASISHLGYLIGRLRQAGAILAKHEQMLAEVLADVDEDADEDVDERVASPEQPAGQAPKRLCGFMLENVTFTYPGKEFPAISNVSLTILPGQVTAIVGESGAGKSTVAAMLCGVYQPQGGTIRRIERDGTHSDLPPMVTARELAIVPQEPFMFADTILENITFGRDEVTPEEARRAAVSARIHDFIMSLPDGYETRIEENGKNLSRGQRQRLAIARALAGRPRVVILDEATASLDVVSERAIKALIDDLRGSMTFVIIAHQGALLAGVDRLIVLRCGEIVFEGQPSVSEKAMDGVLCS